jgi:hypothetical protein
VAVAEEDGIDVVNEADAGGGLSVWGKWRWRLLSMRVRTFL